MNFSTRSCGIVLLIPFSFTDPFSTSKSCILDSISSFVEMSARTFCCFTSLTISSVDSFLLNNAMISISLLAFFTSLKSSTVHDGLDSTSPSFKTTVSTSLTSLSFSYVLKGVSSSSLLNKLFFNACSSIFKLSSILFALDLNQSSVKIDIVFFGFK